MAEPTNVTIKGQREGLNMLLSIGGYGSRALRVIRLEHGIHVVTSEDTAANSKTLNTLNVTSGPFTVIVAFLTREERDSFNLWMHTYIMKVVNNEKVSGYSRVQIPARRFDKYAILKGRLVYGDHIGTLSYPAQLTFISASDPLSAIGQTKLSGVSRVVQASRDDDAAYFYPTYYVDGKSGDAEGVIYGRPKPAPVWIPGPGGKPIPD